MPFKQKYLQPTRVFTTWRALCAALCASCLGTCGALPVIPSAVAQGLPIGSTTQPAKVRLIAAPHSFGGTYEAGVEIAMAAGSHTYWKMPGDSGVPPLFSFDGSQNVARAVVAFPAPTRVSEEGFDTFGYTGRVVFPVAVTPIDGSKPSTLRVDVTYAVCDRICVPGHSAATLKLTSGEEGVSGDLVVGALAQVPKPLPEADHGKLMITPVGTASNAPPGSPAKPVPRPGTAWTLTWTGASPITDIFPDAPEGFLFDTRKLDAHRWLLTASESVGATATVKVPVCLVLKSGEGGFTVSETLDVRPSTQ